MPLPLLELNVEGERVSLSHNVRNFIYEETVFGASPFMIDGRLDERNWNKLEPFVSDPDATTKIRWGYLNGGENWSEWHHIVCGEKRIGYDREHVDFVIEGHDAGYRISETKTGGMFKDKKVSEIIQQIAGNNNFDSVVKGTEGKFSLFSAAGLLTGSIRIGSTPPPFT